MTYKNLSSNNAKDRAGLFKNFFKSIYPPQDLDINIGTNNSDNVALLIEPREIVESLKNLKPSFEDKIDGIPEILLKNCSSLIPYLTDIFNKSIISGIFPDRWKNSIIIPTFKDGLKSDVQNQRPVAQIPMMSKVFDYIMASNFRDLVLNKMVDAQNGFLPSNFGCSFHCYFWSATKQSFRPSSLHHFHK